MQSNTAAVGNQDINFASFSVENRKSDPFTVVDGRYIGRDGFVVPKNFDEFHERFPRIRPQLGAEARGQVYFERGRGGLDARPVDPSPIPTHDLQAPGGWQGGRRADVRSAKALRSEQRPVLQLHQPVPSEQV